MSTKMKTFSMFIKMSSSNLRNFVAIPKLVKSCYKQEMPLHFLAIIAKLECFPSSGFNRSCPKAYFKSSKVNHTLLLQSGGVISANVVSKYFNFGI